MSIRIVDDTFVDASEREMLLDWLFDERGVRSSYTACGHSRPPIKESSPTLCKTRNDYLNVVLTDKPIRYTSKRHCVVKLPYPRQIRSERLVNVTQQPLQPFAGKDGAELHPSNVAMVQVFIYETNAAALLEDETLMEWRPQVQPNKTADLHFFSQPPDPRNVGCFHNIRAYKNLAELFGLEIIPIAELFVKASEPDPKIPGLTRDDLLSLGEPEPAPQALSGSNCDCLVVHNHTPS